MLERTRRLQLCCSSDLIGGAPLSVTLGTTTKPMRTWIGIAVLFACCLGRDVTASEPPIVSLVQLIAHPKDYDGKVVMVVGFLNLQFEGDSIYFHEDDYKHGITKNGLWIQTTPDIKKRESALNHKYVMVNGRFNSKGKGHMGLWSGSIEKISNITVWDVESKRK